MGSKLTPNFVCACINEGDILRADLFPFNNPDSDAEFRLHYYNEWILCLTSDEVLELLQIQREKKAKDLDSYTTEQKEASTFLVNELEALDRCIQMVEELNNG